MPNHHTSRWTPEHDEALLRAYAEGVRLKDIGAEIGASVSSVKHRPSRLGVVSRAAASANFVATPDIEGAKRDLLAGVKRRDITRRRNVSGGALHRLFQNLLDIGLLVRKRSPSTAPDPERSVEIRRRIALGETIMAISAALGCTPNTVRGIAWRDGVRVESDKPARLPKPPKPVKPRVAKIVRERLPGLRPALAPVRVEDEPAPPDAKPLDQLEVNDCRWPFGPRGDVRFCGHPVKRPYDDAPNGRYCAHHRRWACAATVNQMRAAAVRTSVEMAP